jgi:ankyrin repeat protein
MVSLPSIALPFFLSKTDTLLLSKGGIIDHKDRTNRTYLHYAFDRNITKYPSLLIQDTYGMNPVLSAAQEGNLQCLQLFINDNARLNISTGNTN